MRLERLKFHNIHIWLYLLWGIRVRKPECSKAFRCSLWHRPPMLCVVPTLEWFAFLRTKVIANCRVLVPLNMRPLQVAKNCRNSMAVEMIVYWLVWHRRGNLLPHLFLHVLKATLVSRVSSTKLLYMRLSVERLPSRSMSRTMLVRHLQ